MSKTGRLCLPYILQAQAQKEVTHNQALNMLDVYVNTVVEAIVDSPLAAPKDGDIYIVSSNPSDVFDGHASELAQYLSGIWTFYPPLELMQVMLKSTKTKMIYDGKAWTESAKSIPDRSSLQIEQWQEDVKLSGNLVNTQNTLPDHSMVIAVNIRVIEAITGAPSFAVGVKEDPSRYGDKISTAKDTTNIGMTYHPITYYYDTPVTIIPNQMEFTAGVVKVTAQYLKPKIL